MKQICSQQYHGHMILMLTLFYPKEQQFSEMRDQQLHPSHFMCFLFAQL